MTLKNILSLPVLVVALVSCGSDPLDVDVSNMKVSTSFTNMDSVLFLSDSLELMNKHQEFKKELKDLYDYQVGYCLSIRSNIDTTFYNAIQEYRIDTFVVNLETDIASEFKDLTEIKTNITDGLKHLKYHFKNKSEPKYVVFMNSMFNSGAWCTDEAIGIGLERFLGPNNRCVQKLNPMYHYQWMKDDMKREYIERDAILSWVATNYFDAPDGNLAEQMIQSGKMLYLTKAAFPGEEDYWILRYSKEELDWAIENESPFWKYLVDQKMLFENNERNAMNLLKPGPTTPGLPESGGPDRMGQFLGYRMVLNYMENNEVTVEKLVDVPYNDILQEFEIEE